MPPGMEGEAHGQKAQLRLFDLGEALGEEGWMKFLKLDEYAPRQARRPDGLQQVLFPYAEAI